MGSTVYNIATTLERFTQMGYPRIIVTVGACRRGAVGMFFEPADRVVKRGLADPGVVKHFPARIIIDSRCRDFVPTLEHELGHYVEHLLRGATEKTGYSEAYADSFIGKIA